MIFTKPSQAKPSQAKPSQAKPIFAFLIWLCVAIPSLAAELVVNGGFESGNLSGWTTSGLSVPGGCGGGFNATDWNVSNSGAATDCSDPGVPPEGTQAAYNMFDAGQAQTYRLRQTITLPALISNANLKWTDSIVWGFAGAALPRVFTVNVLNSVGGVVLFNAYTNSIAPSNGATGWLPHTVNVTAQLAPFAGQQVVLEFAVAIQEAWTGAAGMGLDAVSLDIPIGAAGQNVASVPTLSEWAQAILVLLVIGLMYRNRKFLRQASNL